MRHRRSRAARLVQLHHFAAVQQYRPCEDVRPVSTRPCYALAQDPTELNAHGVGRPTCVVKQLVLEGLRPQPHEMMPAHQQAMKQTGVRIFRDNGRIEDG